MPSSRVVAASAGGGAVSPRRLRSRRRLSPLPLKPSPFTSPSSAATCAADTTGRSYSSQRQKPSPQAGPSIVAAFVPPLVGPSVVAPCATAAAGRVVRHRVKNPSCWLARFAVGAFAVPATGRRSSSLPPQPSPRAGLWPCSSVIAVFAALRRCSSLPGETNASETPPTVNEVYFHLHTVNHDGVTFIDTRSERFYVDDEAVYFIVAGECPKGRVYGLGSLGKKNMRYADPGASTSQMPEMVPRSEFDSVAEQLRQVVAFMQRQFGMTMDGAVRTQPQPPPPPPPHKHQQPPLVNPTDPP
ncbi:hypothetical protein Syun_009073 [Stephania yunnanensis]|uniref:Uncharacterized protein n=1 Tax=Stephania yunnanensis TaxID=152371 RepID=A0AAP0KFW9_9MAGN